MRRVRPWARVALLLLASALLIVLVLDGQAWARPGGGQSYSGGGGHGDSGGGGGGGAGAELAFRLIFELLRLAFYYPVIFLPILGAIVLYFAWSAYQNYKNKDWNSGPPAELHRAIELDQLRRVDPDFSQVGFEDFAFRLFATAQRNRATPQQRATLTPYVSSAAIQQLASRDAAPSLPGAAPSGPLQSPPVQSVVVGAMRVIGLIIPPPRAPGADDAAADGPVDGSVDRVRISLQFEANVTVGVGDAMRTDFSVETWRLSRAATATSKPPQLGSQADVLPCPNCSAPWAAAQTGTQVCASCNQVVDNGRFDWVVDSIVVNSIQARPPTLTDSVQERGTDLATYRQSNFTNLFGQLCQDDAAVNIADIQNRLTMIYGRLNKAWSDGNLVPVRGLLSMSQYDALQYWVDAYAKQDLRNQLSDMRIINMEPCKLLRDRYFDALTIRIWGAGKDFVVNRSSGRLLTGSKTKDRKYSEYWTLIRSKHAKGPAKTDATCGHCGAALKVDAKGACEYCGSVMASGEFDWVLSKIEQDDSYRG